MTGSAAGVSPISDRTTYREAFCRVYGRPSGISRSPDPRRSQGAPKGEASPPAPDTSGKTHGPDYILTTYRTVAPKSRDGGPKRPAASPSGASPLGPALYPRTTYQDTFGDPSTKNMAEPLESRINFAVPIRAERPLTGTHLPAFARKTTYRDAFAWPYSSRLTATGRHLAGNVTGAFGA
jgi:hypothetical protein